MLNHSASSSMKPQTASGGPHLQKNLAFKVPMTASGGSRASQGSSLNSSYSQKSMMSSTSSQFIIRKSTMIKHNKNDIHKVYAIEKGVSKLYTDNIF